MFDLIVMSNGPGEYENSCNLFVDANQSLLTKKVDVIATILKKRTPDAPAAPAANDIQTETKSATAPNTRAGVNPNTLQNQEPASQGGDGTTDDNQSEQQDDNKT